MAGFNLDYFIHAANILLLGAWCVRDMLWLRALAVASSVAALPYFLFQPTPLWAAFGWSVLFTSINVFQLGRIVLQRRPVQLTAEEEEVRRLAFSDLAPKELLRLISIGSWSSVATGERLVSAGHRIESLSLIVRGKVDVAKDGRVLGELTPGEILGSALILSGAVSEVDAVTSEPCRMLRWEVETLERYLDAHPETRNVFQRQLTRDLAAKLHRVGVEFSEALPPRR